MSQGEKDGEGLFRRYFGRNEFEKGFQEIIQDLPAPEMESEWTDAHRWKAINALQLGILYQLPGRFHELLKRYEPVLLKPDTGDLMIAFEYQLVEARIHYLKGFHLRAYRLLTALSKDFDAFYRKVNPKLTRRKRFFFIARMNDLAGKTLHRDSDHTLARLHTALAYDRLKSIKDDPSDSTRYLSGKVYTIFARSFFDFRRFLDPKTEKSPDSASHQKPSAILRLLGRAEEEYRSYFGDSPTQVKSVFFAEIEELRALYYIHIRDFDIPEAENWFDEAIAQLDLALATIRGANIPEGHRRYCHILRFRALAYLRRAQQIHRYGTKSDDEAEKMKTLETVKEKLTEADALYEEEINLRLQFFQQAAHPTLARAFNYRARVNIVLAEIVHLLGDKPGFNDHVKLANDFLNSAEEFNRKSDYDRNFDEKLAESTGAPGSQLPEYINDYQLFRTQGRRLQLHNLLYRYGPEEWRERHYQSLLTAFTKCVEARKEALSWLYWDESRQTILDEFRPMQEAVLEVCHLHQQVPGIDRQPIFDEMLKVHLHGNRDDDWYTPHPVNPAKIKDQKPKNSFKGEMHRLQRQNLKILDLSGKRKNSKKERRSLRRRAKNLIAVDHEMVVRQKTNQQQARAAGEPQESVSIDGIFQQLDHHDRGCVISVFGGNKHISALCIIQGEKRGDPDPPPESIVLGQALGQYVSVKDIRHKVQRLTDAINAVQKAVELHDSNTGKDPVKDFFEKMLCRGEMRLHRTDRADPIDHLNTELMCASYEVYRVLIAPLNLPGYIKRVYLTFNQGHLQAIPFNMLCTEDPRRVFSTDSYLPFNAMNYFGRRYRSAFIPSVQALWRLRRGMMGASPTQYSLGSTNERLSPYYRFLGVHGTETIQSVYPKTGYNSIPLEGVTALKLLVNEILSKRRINKADEYEIHPDINTNDPHDEKSADRLLRKACRSLIVHFFCHVRLDRFGRFALKTIVLHEKKTKEDGKVKSEPTHEINTHEVTSYDLRNCFLAFINGCGSAEGKIRPGDIPESMMAAFLEAGARGAIGTHYPTYVKQASVFADLFYNSLFDEKHVFTIGQSIQRTIESILTMDQHSKCAHPLHWGSYVYMGDTTVNLDEMLSFADLPVEKNSDQ